MGPWNKVEGNSPQSQTADKEAPNVLAKWKHLKNKKDLIFEPIMKIENIRYKRCFIHEIDPKRALITFK